MDVEYQGFVPGRKNHVVSYEKITPRKRSVKMESVTGSH